MEKANRILEVLIYENLIPACIFQINENHLESYISCYSNIFGKAIVKKKSEKSLARKIAGLNLLKYNFKLGAKFSDIDAGLVYLIGNPSYPLHLKVGMTIDLISRLEHYQTADPFRKFFVSRYDFVLNRSHVEQRILLHPDALKEKGEWLQKDSAANLFELIVKNKGSITQ